MKIIFALVLAAFAVVAVADVSELGTEGRPSNEYLAPFEAQQGGGGLGGGAGGAGGAGGVNRDYLPPTQSGEPAPAHSHGPDGYRYKNPTRF